MADDALVPEDTCQEFEQRSLSLVDFSYSPPCGRQKGGLGVYCQEVWILNTTSRKLALKHACKLKEMEIFFFLEVFSIWGGFHKVVAVLRIGLNPDIFPKSNW